MVEPGTQIVNGHEYPTGPRGRQFFRSEGEKWRAIKASLDYVMDCLGPADRGFYRQTIGLHSMALCNLRDRGEVRGTVEEVPLPWETPAAGTR